MQRNIRLLAVLSIATINLILGIGYTGAQTTPAQRTDQKIPGVLTPSKTEVPAIDTFRNYDTGKTAPTQDQSARQAPFLTLAEPDPTLNHEIFEDFLNGSGHTILEKINQMAAAGGGTGQAWLYGPAYEDAWGVIEAHHGTGPNSRLDLVGKTPNMHAVVMGAGTAYEYQVRFNFANLSNETNRFITFDGFFDGDTIDPDFNRGILFRYSDNINDGKFQIVVREAAGIETLMDTGIAPVINEWYRLKITVNASGTEALFFINSIQVGAVTTNIALGAVNRYTAESDNDRTSGTTSFISRRFDYVRFRATAGRGSRL